MSSVLFVLCAKILHIIIYHWLQNWNVTKFVAKNIEILEPYIYDWWKKHTSKNRNVNITDGWPLHQQSYLLYKFIYQSYTGNIINNNNNRLCCKTNAKQTYIDSIFIYRLVDGDPCK